MSCELVIAALERNNPCYRERHIESSRPGELLSVDTSKISELPDGTKITLHAVVDTYGSYAFGLLHSSKQPEASALLLHNDVLPFYAQHMLSIEVILSDNGRGFYGTPSSAICKQTSILGCRNTTLNGHTWAIATSVVA